MAEPILDVWIIEDNEHFRDTLVELLEDAADIDCTLQAASCQPALREARRGRSPDVVLMDLGLPDLDGVEGIRRLTELTPATEIVAVTAHDDEDRVLAALCAGAIGYLLKPVSSDEVLGAIRGAARGASPINGAIARKVLRMFTQVARPRQEYGLTDRERDILGRLVDARTQREIAETLYLSPHTVDTHVRSIYRKLQVHSRTSAVAKALREGLL